MGFRSPMNGLPPSSITADMLEDNAVQTSHLAPDAITAKHTITGAKFRTAAAGQRWEIDADLNNEIRAYSGQADELEPGKLLITGPVLELRGARTTDLPTEGEEPKLELTHEHDGTAWSGLASLIGGGELHLVGMREVDPDGSYSTNEDNLILTKGDTEIRGAVTVSYAGSVAPVLDVGSDFSPIGKTRIDESGVKVYDDVDPNVAHPPSVVMDGAGIRLTGETWHVVGATGEPAYQNGHAAFSAQFAPEFRKAPDGGVFIRGVLANQGTAVGVFVLPAGYRPTKAMAFNIHNGTNASERGRIRIDPSGQVDVYVTESATGDRDFRLDCHFTTL